MVTITLHWFVWLLILIAMVVGWVEAIDPYIARTLAKRTQSRLADQLADCPMIVNHYGHRADFNDHAAVPLTLLYKVSSLLRGMPYHETAHDILASVDEEQSNAWIEWLAANYVKVEPFELPTGQGDADVGWRFSVFHQAIPSEVVIYEHFSDDLRAAFMGVMQQRTGERGYGASSPPTVNNACPACEGYCTAKPGCVALSNPVPKP